MGVPAVHSGPLPSAAFPLSAPAAGAAPLWRCNVADLACGCGMMGSSYTHAQGLRVAGSGFLAYRESRGV
eukprot:354567-Chlamydomonas_euryale.AAC.6